MPTTPDAREWSVSVLLADPPHPYASNPRLTVLAATTAEIYAFVREQYPSGVVMGIWPKSDRSPS
jgi:hypothetical protein